jgi:flavin-dependent dehydrogenase
MEQTAEYDALIIGGGPGGSTAATYLARAGRRVLLLEKERFPRFHIGESLLPYNRAIFEEMGVLPKLEAAGFVRKHGAQFHLGNGSKTLSLVFKNGRFTREPLAYQVERARFDHILLQHAAECGAKVLEGWTVTRTDTDAQGAYLDATGPEGERRHFRASYLIDASGRGNLTGNQQGLRQIHPRLRKVAVFGHFRGVPIDPGDPGGDTVIIRLENKWFWLIPLQADKVSVGCVMDQEELASAKVPPGELFDLTWRSSPVLRQRLDNAQLLGPVQTTSDFSYYNRRLIDRRLLRVGDAAGFMDPIFSAGVYLAMYSGRLAANVISDCLAAGHADSRRFARYERQVFRAMKLYWGMVERFYTTPFMEVFLEPRHRLDLPAAVTALLAGELENRWTLGWRLRFFYAVVRLQKWLPLVPRLSFAPQSPAAGG